MGGRTIRISGLPSIHKTSLLQFLQETLGKDYVSACKMGQPNNFRGKVFAIVQFENAEMAMKVYELAKAGKLRFWNGRLLAVNFMNRDIASRPKCSPSCLQGVKLHMGCQSSANGFHVLWSALDVFAEFGFDIRRIILYVTEFHDYKLELSFRDIWEINLRNVKGGTKALLLQMQSGPKIYQKKELPLGSNYEDAKSDSQEDDPDFQWIRTTDFTRFSSIGQSSCICLELDNGTIISQICKKFAHYIEIEEKLCLKYGISYSSSLNLVPIISPPDGVQLPYEIMFKINSLVQFGFLSGPSLNKEFFSLLQPTRRPLAHINLALSNLSCLRNTCYEPTQWLHKQFDHIRRSNMCPNSAAISLDSGLMYVNRVQATPSKVYFFGPEVNVSNRVTRHYAEYINDFLRVSFVDENLGRLHSNDLSLRMDNRSSEKRTKLYKRILQILRDGIVIGNKRFEFLAFSSSQLRESAVWMFASNGIVNAANIREWMGDFSSIRNVAKCAARIGQSFSSSTETLHVYGYEIKIIRDIQVRNGDTTYNFSDGIGKISLPLAKLVALKCGCEKNSKRIPSAFQIRYGGYKGVVAVDPTSSDKLSLRLSMWKYDSNNTNLEVLSWTRFRPCFLNRQIIALLSTLGVEDRSFESLQQQAITRLDELLNNREMALEVLQIMSSGDSHKALIDMLSCGYAPNFEPYLSMILHAFRLCKLLELRNRARIFVPKGRCLMGCLDEIRTLKYGEVFVQVSHTPGDKGFHDAGLSQFGRNGLDHLTCVIEGRVIVAKNPCLHPGDIRILRAVNIPGLHHMVDCLVFPQQGKRPHPDECSGSDLDGDLYFISWDESLIPPQQDPPMEYVSEPLKVLDHDVTIEEIQEYFVNYMVNDSLGIIANSHTAFADQEPSMARSASCLQLAELFSRAVDFPKTGIPAQIPANLHPKEYPDFMEKEDKPTYESKRVLGKLYRSVKDLASQTLCISSFTEEVAKKAYDNDLEVEGFEIYLSEALVHKNWYDCKLASLMDYYGVKTEAEIISGNIINLSIFHGNRKHGDLKETIMYAVRSLRKEARGWFENSFDDYQNTAPSSADKQSARASAWYHVTYHPNYWGRTNLEGSGTSDSHFISFPWVVYDKLLSIKRKRRPHVINTK